MKSLKFFQINKPNKTHKIENKRQTESENLQTIEITENHNSCAKKTADTVQKIIEIIDERKEKISNRELLKICQELDFFNAGTNPHLIHEIAETSLNLLVKSKYAKILLNSDQPAKVCEKILKPLQTRLPTQSWRSEEQILRQQFSAPPTIAYLLSFLMNFKANETVLEPSAETGSLSRSGFRISDVRLKINPNPGLSPDFRFRFRYLAGFCGFNCFQ